MTFEQYLKDRVYPGRGIGVGKTADGSRAVIVYFIMGRSANSQNRIFSEEGETLMIYPYDESKVEDPSLIIYAPLRCLGENVIVTNGDQTDTIYDGLKAGKTFAEALETRQFEPDPPIFTPRISSMLTFCDSDFKLQMSELKSKDDKGSECVRYTYDCRNVPGKVNFISTYEGDGNPVNTYSGAPAELEISGDIDELTDTIWNALNPEYRISMYVQYINLADGTKESRLINRFQKQGE